MTITKREKECSFLMHELKISVWLLERSCKSFLSHGYCKQQRKRKNIIIFVLAWAIDLHMRASNEHNERECKRRNFCYFGGIETNVCNIFHVEQLQSAVDFIPHIYTFFLRFPYIQRVRRQTRSIFFYLKNRQSRKEEKKLLIKFYWIALV